MKKRIRLNVGWDDNLRKWYATATFSIKGEKILITAQGRTLEKLRRQIDEELRDLEDILGLEKGTLEPEPVSE